MRDAVVRVPGVIHRTVEPALSGFHGGARAVRPREIRRAPSCNCKVPSVSLLTTCC